MIIFEEYLKNVEPEWHKPLKKTVDYIRNKKRKHQISENVQLSPKSLFPCFVGTSTDTFVAFAQRARGISFYLSNPTAVNLYRTDERFIKVSEQGCINIYKPSAFDLARAMKAIDIVFNDKTKKSVSKKGANAKETKIRNRIQAQDSF